MDQPLCQAARIGGAYNNTVESFCEAETWIGPGRMVTMGFIVRF